MRIEQSVVEKIITYVKKTVNRFTFEEHMKEDYFPITLSSLMYEKCYDNYVQTKDFRLQDGELVSCMEEARGINYNFVRYCFTGELNVLNVSEDINKINFIKNEKEPSIRSV